MGEVAVESLTKDAMNRSRIFIAVGMTVAVALFTGTLASGTEKVARFVTRAWSLPVRTG